MKPMPAKPRIIIANVDGSGTPPTARDEYADPSWDIESARFDRSVLTGRSLKEIKDEMPINPAFGRRRA